jgi:hypothetical protein
MIQIRRSEQSPVEADKPSQQQQSLASSSCALFSIHYFIVRTPEI